MKGTISPRPPFTLYYTPVLGSLKFNNPFAYLLIVIKL